MSWKFSQDGIYKNGVENFGGETSQKISTWKIKKETDNNIRIGLESFTYLYFK